jgi:GGDEF domain-containing protein
VAVYPQHAGDAEALLRVADEAMYEAKRAGRDRVVVNKAVPASG